MEVDLVAIAGMDAAIVGTCLSNRREVLCYNYAKCVELIVAQGTSEADAELFIAELSSTDVEGAPVFVHFNDEQFFYDGYSDSGTVH